MPSFAEILKEYLWVSATYMWTLLPGVLMVLPDVINWFREREIHFPRWLKISMFVIGLLAAQFLAYRDVRLRLETEIRERVKTESENKTLSSIALRRRHTLEPNEPAFGNTSHLLNAFRMYRNALGPNTKCTIYVTAPSDSAPMAWMVHAFSIATSDCGTFGLFGPLAPSREKEILEGSVSGSIILNAREDDRAADILLNNLVPNLPVRRGYKTIPNGHISEIMPNYIWLQFGTSTKFTSETMEEH